MDILRRPMAPISDRAWQEIEGEAKRVLHGTLSARRLVDFSGPGGWEKAAVNLGQLRSIKKSPINGVNWGLRQVQPLLEFRVPFTLDLWELDNVDRGSATPDLDGVGEAARKAALFEETVLYHGLTEAGIKGLCPAADQALGLPQKAGDVLPVIEEAVLCLQKQGVNGPYQLVLGTEAYRLIMVGDNHGYPLQRRVGELIGSDIKWSPALEAGVLFSRRGGDFLFTSGQDLSIGYHAHDVKKVDLFLTESFTFQVFEPAAAVSFKWQ